MFDSEHKRYLQSILDSVSASTNLPIRLLSLEQLTSLSDEDVSLVPESENLEVVFAEMLATMKGKALSSEEGNASPILSLEMLAQSDEEIDGKYRQATVKLAALEDALIKTAGANLHTFSDLLRLSPEWRWFELLWFYINRASFLEPSIDAFDIQAFELPEWHFVCKRLSCESDYLLLTGPLNTIQRQEEREAYFDVGGKSLMDIYVRFNEHYCRKSVTKRFSTEEVDRVLRLRVPVTRASVLPRVTLAEKVISIVSVNCSILICKQSIDAASEPSTMRVATDLTLAAGRLAQSHYFYDSVVKEYHAECEGEQASVTTCSAETFQKVVFEFSIPLNDENRALLEMGMSLRRSPSDSSLEWRYETPFQLKSAAAENLLNAIHVNGVKLSNKEFLQSVEEKLDRWSETSYTRRKSYLGNRSNLIGNWLSHNFLRTKNAPDDGSNGKSGNGRSEVYNILCHFIAESTRTEMCQIYRYYAHKGTGVMEVLGRSVRGNFWSLADSDAIVDHMTVLANSTEHTLHEKGEKSVVYRAASSRRLVYVDVPLKTDDKDLDNVTWPGDVAQPRAIAAAPILIEGRVWGVIEIATPYQGAIEKTVQYSLSDYSGVLGVYFFSITYNQNIRSLGLWGGSEFTLSSNEISDVSDMFAERICRITLGQAAVVLLQKPNEGGSVYEIAGCAGENRPGLGGKHPEIDLLTDNGKRFLAGRLWSGNVENKLTFVAAEVDQRADESKRTQTGDVILLGKEYFQSLDDENSLGNVLSNTTRQIVAFTFDVILDLGVSVSDSAFGIDLESIRRADPGPTGMVLVYFDEFIDRPHWHGVNADIAIRLANCYKDILVDRVRQSEKGALIRHEVKQTVFAIEAAATEIRRTAGFVRQRLAESKRYEGVPLPVVERISDVSESTQRLMALTDNMANANELLATQIQSIERADYADLNVFSTLLPDGVYRSTYTCLPELLDLFSLQYKQRFHDRSLNYDFDELPSDIHLRIRSEYMSFLVRNIFDNWAKYAASGTVVSVEIEPKYSTVKRSDFYTIVFSNFVEKEISDEEAEGWFSYGVRGNTLQSNSAVGDGIGLFWIRQILERRFGIQVFFKTSKTSSGRSKVALCWYLASRWLTTVPELEIGE